MEHTVHDTTFQPYPDGSGPQFSIRTWYSGVLVNPCGQSSVKLGYCLKMGDEVILESLPGEEDYVPPAHKPFDDDSALADLMAFLTNDFLIAEFREKAEESKKALFSEYQKHLMPLWDSIILRYGEVVCYGNPDLYGN